MVQWLPDSYTMLIRGPPGAGKTPSIYHWINFYLRNNRPCILLSFDDLPSNLRSPLGAYTDGKLPEYENSGLETIVDCYASIAGASSQEKYALRNRCDLNELSPLISDLLNEKSSIGSPKIIIDSATPLFTYKDPQLIVQFLGSMAAKTKAKNGAFLVLITTGTVGDEVLRRLETLMDYSLEMQVQEVEGRKKRRMRIAKARGRQAYEDWIPYFIGSKAVFLDVGEEPAQYERLKKALRANLP